MTTGFFNTAQLLSLNGNNALTAIIGGNAEQRGFGRADAGSSLHSFNDVMSGILDRAQSTSRKSAMPFELGTVNLDSNQKGAVITALLKQQCHYTGQFPCETVVTPEALDALSVLLNKAGFDDTDIAQTVTTLRDENDASDLVVSDLVAAVEDLSSSTFSDKAPDDETMLEISALPYIETILSRLGLDQNKINEVTDSAVEEGRGIKLSVLTENLQSVKGSSFWNNGNVMNESVQTQAETETMMHRIGLDFIDGKGAESLDTFITRLENIVNHDAPTVMNDSVLREEVEKLLSATMPSTGQDETDERFNFFRKMDDSRFFESRNWGKLFEKPTSLNADAIADPGDSKQKISSELKIDRNGSTFLAGSNSIKMQNFSFAETGSRDIVDNRGQNLGLHMRGEHVVTTENLIRQTENLKKLLMNEGITARDIKIDFSVSSASEQAVQQLSDAIVRDSGQQRFESLALHQAFGSENSGMDLQEQGFSGFKGRDSHGRSFLASLSSTVLKDSTAAESKNNPDPSALQFMGTLERAAGSMVKTVSPETSRMGPQSMPSTVTEQAIQQLSHSIPRGERQLQLNLEPAHLGRLQMTINNNGDNLTVHIMAEHDAAKEMLLSHSNELKSALMDQGIRLDKVTVQSAFNFEHYAGSQQQSNASGGNRRNARGVFSSQPAGEIDADDELLSAEPLRKTGTLNVVA